MEGTRHEKIALAVVSYIIGFTTAFIAFGVNKIDESSVESAVVFKNPVIEKVTQEPNVINGVALKEDGLFAKTALFERMLSAKQTGQSASLIAASGTSGFYFNILDAQVSLNGKFVYFCEQLTEEAESCDPYVYDLASDSLHRVKVNGEKVTLPLTPHSTIWTSENLIDLSTAISSDAQSPWNLEAKAQ